jgi:hypothetical protein
MPTAKVTEKNIYGNLEYEHPEDEIMRTHGDTHTQIGQLVSSILKEYTEY